MPAARLEPVYIGQYLGTAIYRVDLGQSGLSAIRSITIYDDNKISGGRGSHSGVDLDFVKLSNLVDSPAAVWSLVGEAAFDFSSSGVVFQPGFQTPTQWWDPPTLGGYLLGTTGANIYDPSASTLASADGRTDGIGALSLGEGGQITFLLTASLSPSGRYLYFGDTGTSDQSYVIVSDEATSNPTDFTLYGTPGDDRIVLGVGVNAHLRFTKNTVYGLQGNDVILGSYGTDTLNGGPGNDRISGGPGNDRLLGGAGSDVLGGGAGNDWLFGGAGIDKLRGGAGKDAFGFDTKLHSSRNVDRIYDFNPKDDGFYLDDVIFRKIGKGSLEAPKKLGKAAFWSGDSAHDSSGRIIYDSTTGNLYYDRDGVGTSAPIKFAQLAKGLKLTYHDFLII